MPCGDKMNNVSIVSLFVLLCACESLVEALGIAGNTYVDTLSLVPSNQLLLSAPSASLRRGVVAVQNGGRLQSAPSTQIRTISRDPNFLTKLLNGQAYRIPGQSLSLPSQGRGLSSQGRQTSSRQSPRITSVTVLQNSIPSARLGHPPPPYITRPSPGFEPSGPWGYDDFDSFTSGPSFWTGQFPMCGERFQSPVDISGSTISYQPLNPIFLDQQEEILPLKIRNSGSTVSLKPVVEDIILHGGNLPGTFILADIHFHWGRLNSKGSEHKLEGRSYPLEMHIVGYNSKYPTLDDAYGEEDGIHAMGIFFDVSRRPNVGLDLCISQLAQIRSPGNMGPTVTLNMSRIFPPPSVPFYRYRGSLTTPPCTENVIWSVYKTPQVISVQQMNMFRQVSLARRLGTDGSNSRPLQHLNRRRIVTNNPLYMNVG